MAVPWATMQSEMSCSLAYGIVHILPSNSFVIRHLLCNHVGWRRDVPMSDYRRPSRLVPSHTISLLTNNVPSGSPYRF